MRREAERRTVYSQFDRGPNGIYMAVNEDWKYVYSVGDNREWLFNRKTDPHERRSVAGVRFAAPARDAMKADLLGYLKSVGAEEAYLETIKTNVLMQCENLRTYPCVKQREGDGTLSIHAWLYDLHTGVISEHRAASGTWENVAFNE